MEEEHGKEELLAGAAVTKFVTKKRLKVVHRSPKIRYSDFLEKEYEEPKKKPPKKTKNKSSDIPSGRARTGNGPQDKSKVRAPTKGRNEASYKLADKATGRTRPDAATKFRKVVPNTVQSKFRTTPQSLSPGKFQNKIVGTTQGKFSNKTHRSPGKLSMSKSQIKALNEKNARKFRQASIKREKEAVQTFQQVRETTITVARKVAEFARRNVGATITIAGFLLTIIVVSAGLGSCAAAFSSGTGTYFTGMCHASDSEMTACDSYFDEKEMKLDERIANIETEFPDFDEYVIDAVPTGHDSIKLMAYLSAIYDSYDLSGSKAKLDEIFDAMYELTITSTTETRTRSVLNEETGEYEDEEYDVTILTVTLTANAWDTVIDSFFPDDESKDRYGVYLDTGGAHQAFYNPFTVDWSNHVSSPFGWRLHPIYGDERFHNGMDIAMASGTEIHACSTGKVITATYASSEGNYIVIEDESGYKTYYMHLTGFNVSVGDEVKHGDIIGTVGSTGDSTGPHLHLGIKDASGNWLNPEFLVSNYTGGIS